MIIALFTHSVTHYPSIHSLNKQWEIMKHGRHSIGILQWDADMEFHGAASSAGGVDVRGQLGTSWSTYIWGRQKDVCINHARRKVWQNNMLKGKLELEKCQYLTSAGYFKIKAGFHSLGAQFWECASYLQGRLLGRPPWVWPSPPAWFLCLCYN